MKRHRGDWGQYRGYLSIAFYIALGSLPFFWRSGPIACVAVLTVATFVFGSCFFAINQIASLVRSRSFILQIVLKAILQSIALAVSMIIVTVFSLAVTARVGPFNPGLWRAIARMLTPGQAIGFFLLGLLLATMISGFFAFSKKLGPGVLWNWLTGKYYAPREEELVFLFLDMKNSTTLAEQLGTLRFSALVRAFFEDLTPALGATQARVSHYIGDEAVIFWSPAAAVKDANCLRLFFHFQQAIESRSAEYRAVFGLVPEFKAGAHVGKVVATEVGDVKSEIVYHGDVLNTASRIQSLCNEEGQSFLISGELAAMMPHSEEFDLVPLGSRQLKGKEAEVEIVSVQFRESVPVRSRS